uniref:Rab_C38 protein n=1 Tax=Paramecium tetraurelia TaxID=5888 RepID=Q3SD66_PARTE|nr:rab_C38 [Paramecium tetraurelia]
MVKIICLISDYLFKVLLIGNSGVGCNNLKIQKSRKTNLEIISIILSELILQIFMLKLQQKIKVFQIDRSTVKLQIWDTAGQDRFRTITSSYYRGAQGIIIVFDVTDRESFNQIRQWIQEIDKFAAESVNKILVGNKIDSSQRRVSTDEAEALGIQFYYLSQIIQYFIY